MKFKIIILTILMNTKVHTLIELIFLINLDKADSRFDSLMFNFLKFRGVESNFIIFTKFYVLGETKIYQ